jgi:hypothetical protein
MKVFALGGYGGADLVREADCQSRDTVISRDDREEP